MSEQEIYEQLIDWLRQNWYGIPEADEMRPMVKATYTPEEASFLTGMPFSARSLEELAEIKQMDPAGLKEKLEALVKKGLVFRTVRGDSVRYRLNDTYFVFGRVSYWGGGTDERTKKMAASANKYFLHGFMDQYAYTHAKGLRVLPIQEVIEDTRHILPYDEVVKVLDSVSYYTVSICPCKHRKNIDPDSPNCEYPTEVCLHFDQLGHYIVDSGIGREITREETEDILRQSAEVGLVHGVSPWDEGVDTICNCDPCCCIWFEAFHKLKHDMSLTPSSYRVRIDPDSCIGCGLCVKRCHMGAIHLEEYPEARDRVTVVEGKELKNKLGKVAVLNPELCIGCGVCAYKCSTKSLVLERLEGTEAPPKDAREYTRIVTTDFAAGKAYYQ